MNEPKQNEIETLLDLKLVEVENEISKIRECLSLSRQKPNSGVHSTLILEYPVLAQVATKLNIVSNEISYFFRYNTNEISYGDD